MNSIISGSMYLCHQNCIVIEVCKTGFFRSVYYSFLFCELLQLNNIWKIILKLYIPIVAYITDREIKK